MARRLDSEDGLAPIDSLILKKTALKSIFKTVGDAEGSLEERISGVAGGMDIQVLGFDSSMVLDGGSGLPPTGMTTVGRPAIDEDSNK
jgi:hypothetical protein